MTSHACTFYMCHVFTCEFMQHVATFPDDQCDKLYQFISDLDYSDLQPPGPVKRTVSSESGESIGSEGRPPADWFAFSSHYSDELSVRANHSGELIA